MAKAASSPNQGDELSESYISIGLGLLVVIVVGILLYNYFTQRNKTQEAAKNADKITQEATMSAKPGSTYTVVAGDTLWSIAEKSYKSGYNWVDIAKANNLKEGDKLEAGQQLVIPEASPILPMAEASAAASASPVALVASPTVAPATPVSSPAAMVEASPAPTIQGNTYTIVRGDTLWDIACRAYGDCYAWPKIAQANKLSNPDLIFADNTLTLPR